VGVFVPWGVLDMICECGSGKWGEGYKDEAGG
jgi:hypothetical protein